MYTKTHGHQLLVNNLYAEEKTAVYVTSLLLNGRDFLKLIVRRKSFHWNSFVVASQSHETFSPDSVLCTLDRSNVLN